MGESNRYILDKNTGFSVMVNLYIISYLYKKGKKSTVFVEKSGKRKVYKNFYKHIIEFSRPRFLRIMHGQNFQLSAEERERLCSMFGLTSNYFQKDGKIIQIRTLKEEDWQYFFCEKYGVNYKNKVPLNIVKKKADNVERVLDSLLKDDIIEIEYDVDTALYRIYHYIKNGIAYKEESRLKRFLRLLSELKLSDWEEIEDDIDKMERYHDILLRHTDYLKVVVDYKHAKEKK